MLNMFELLDNKEEKRAILEEYGSVKAGARPGTLSAKLGGLLSAAGSDLTAGQQRFSEIEGRFAKSRFHLAVLSRFKRGKSTLLNALLGENLVPAAVITLTSVPILISCFPQRTIEVFYFGGSNEDFTVPSRKNLGTADKGVRHYISEVVPAVFNRKLEKTAQQMDEHINAIIRSYQQELFNLIETMRRTAAGICSEINGITAVIEVLNQVRSNLSIFEAALSDRGHLQDER